MCRYQIDYVQQMSQPTIQYRGCCYSEGQLFGRWFLHMLAKIIASSCYCHGCQRIFMKVFHMQRLVNRFHMVILFDELQLLTDLSIIGLGRERGAVVSIANCDIPRQIYDRLSNCTRVAGDESAENCTKLLFLKRKCCTPHYVPNKGLLYGSHMHDHCYWYEFELIRLQFHNSIKLHVRIWTGGAGFHNSAVIVTPQDIAPTHSGSVFGLMNTFGSIPGKNERVLTIFIEYFCTNSEKFST